MQLTGVCMTHCWGLRKTPPGVKESSPRESDHLLISAAKYWKVSQPGAWGCSWWGGVAGTRWERSNPQSPSCVTDNLGREKRGACMVGTGRHSMHFSAAETQGEGQSHEAWSRRGDFVHNITLPCPFSVCSLLPTPSRQIWLICHRWVAYYLLEIFFFWGNP